MASRVGRIVGIAVGLVLLAVAGQAQEPPRVVASFSILADIVRNVAGPDLDVAALVGPDTDAHTYQPTPADARTLAAAKIFVVNGLGFEGWTDRLARAAPFRGQRIVASDGVQPLTMAAGGHDHGHNHGVKGGTRTVTDPHCWQDLACGQRYAEAIGRGIAAADAAGAEGYRARAAAYAARLAELDKWVRAELAKVPAGKRKVITGHDAFGYFARAYGVVFLAPTGVNTEQQPSARDVAALISLIRREGVKAIFMENMTNPSLVQQVARDAGGVVGPKLYVDALSRGDGPAPTYEQLFRHNVGALVEGMLKN